jgi:hypothetical protein
MCGSLECILKGMKIVRPACMLLGVQTGMKKIVADRMGWFPPSPRNLRLVFYRWAMRFALFAIWNWIWKRPLEIGQDFRSEWASGKIQSSKCRHYYAGHCWVVLPREMQRPVM